jgi:hypothetical protein
LSPEKAEINPAIIPVFKEEFMAAKAHVPWMLQNEEAILFDNT